MEMLLDFIAANPFVAIILIGLIISLFNSNKKAKQQGMPSFGGDKGKPDGRQPQRVPQQGERGGNVQGRAAQSQGAPLQSTPADPALAEAVRQLALQRQQEEEQQRKHEVERREQEKVRQRQQAAKRAKERKPAAAVAAAQLSRPGERLPREEEMRRAIVWAEVLGPPRAKRPFR